MFTNGNIRINVKHQEERVCLNVCKEWGKQCWVQTKVRDKFENNGKSVTATADTIILHLFYFNHKSLGTNYLTKRCKILAYGISKFCKKCKKHWMNKPRNQWCVFSPMCFSQLYPCSTTVYWEDKAVGRLNSSITTFTFNTLAKQGCHRVFAHQK